MTARPVKIEAFIGQPPCPGCLELEDLCREMGERLGARLEFQIFKGQEGRERMKGLGLKVVPALVVEGLIRIEGICPSRETFFKALREFGVNE